ncbi:hypothetical protein TELCIR_03524 [Teladorsagia circumcincta]|uniref:Endonuclease/exonuclease/phosphatase domain-containing protein n=1 Tax=Teladorsagia circumcincta TaxID=45464 RepID=A0A2G9UWB5_TELCI|nr:hypothetical protein TELCIR_03524 [Teladorsagia circumcincta]
MQSDSRIMGAAVILKYPEFMYECIASGKKSSNSFSNFALLLKIRRVPKLGHLARPQVVDRGTAVRRGAEIDGIERFYEEIETALKLKSTYTIVQGDFNADVISRSDDTECLIGKHALGVRSSRGRPLIEFAEQHQFSVMNTYSEKKAKRLWTRRSPDTTTLR